jgi:hypothetical protein
MRRPVEEKFLSWISFRTRPTLPYYSAAVGSDDGGEENQKEKYKEK